VMYGNLPSWGSFDPLPHYLEFRLSDAGTSVWNQIGTFSGTAPDGREYVHEKDMHVVAQAGAPADAVVTGEAGAMDAWLWQRRDDAGITVTGDPVVFAHARELLANPTD
jgi:MDMPI C-terminal domain